MCCIHSSPDLSSKPAYLESLPLEGRHGRVVRVHVDKGIDELHCGVCLVVDIVLFPRHQLTRCRFSRPRRPRQPEYPAFLLAVGRYVRAALVHNKVVTG